MKSKTQWNGVICIASVALMATVGCYPKDQNAMQKSLHGRASSVETKLNTASEAKPTVLTKQCYHFAKNSSNLTEEVKRKLSTQAHYLVAHPSVHISLVGHMSSHESPKKLGKLRAKSIAAYLKTQGVTSGQITLNKPKKGLASMENCQVELNYQVQK